MTHGEMIPGRSESFGLYGDEAARFTAFQQLTYVDFKQHIIEIHDRICGLPPEESAGMDGGEGYIPTDFGPHRFPRLTDTERLLAYALDLAQSSTDMQRAALIMCTAVVATKPFDDRNGATKRALYMELSRGWSVEQQLQSGLLSPHARDEADMEARAVIDLGSALHEEHEDIVLPELIEEYVYEAGNVPAAIDYIMYIRPGETYDTEFTYQPEDFTGLSDEEVKRLKDALIMIESVPYAQNLAYGYFGDFQDHGGLRYGLNHLMAQERDNIVLFGVWANFFGTLQALSVDNKRLLLSKVDEYHTLQARAAIDFVASDAHVINTDKGPITVADFLRKHTNNFVTSNVPRAPAD